MYLFCTTQADLDVRMIARNPSRRPLSVSRARSWLLPVGAKGWMDDVMILISSPLPR